MMDRHDAKLSVKRQAELLEVSRTSVYYLPVNRDKDEIAIMHRIDEIYTHWPHYGHRRIRHVLQDEGIVISKKKTCRLMRRMGLAGLCPGPNLSKRNHKQAVHPYLLRGVKATHPNHIWGIAISMDGKGRATDNAITERFFRNLNYPRRRKNIWTSLNICYPEEALFFLFAGGETAALH